MRNMDVEERVRVVKGIAEEIITEEDLRRLLEEKKHPIAYDGFEPSGLAHLPFGVYRPLLIKELLRAGIGFKIYLADWFAWINRKYGGDLEKIQKVGKYFLEVWKAAGVPFKRGVRYVWASDLVMEREYWKMVIRVAKHTTVRRTLRALTIMGRKEGEMNEVAQFFYPMMQCADIFMLGVDICQLGMDQRKINMLAREVGPKLGLWKPVAVHHHLLMGLEGPKKMGGYDENKEIDLAISSKMSKSKPKSAIFVHDSREEIFAKMRKAYCPAKDVKNNPVLDYAKEIVFRVYKEVKVERPRRYGGDVVYRNYASLERDFAGGGIHPLDLKNAIADYLDKIVSPIRKHFERGRGKRLYEEVKSFEVTR